MLILGVSLQGSTQTCFLRLDGMSSCSHTSCNKSVWSIVSHKTGDYHEYEKIIVQILQLECNIHYKSTCSFFYEFPSRFPLSYQCDRCLSSLSVWGIDGACRDVSLGSSLHLVAGYQQCKLLGVSGTQCNLHLAMQFTEQ